MSDTALVTVPETEIRLGSLAVSRPADMIVRASEIATVLANVVKDRKLSRNISGREYVYVEGWATMGAMIGILPREVGVIEHDNGDFEATVELIRVSDGAIVGQGSAIVGYEEQTWAKRPRYAKRSMAITRATGKAYRLGFSWIMALAGYAPTPAEEMDGIVDADVRHAPIDNGHTDASFAAEFERIPTAQQERAEQNGKAEHPAMAAMQLGAQTAQFTTWCTGFADVYPHYAKSGKADMAHIMRAVASEGFAAVTPENIAAVCKALEARAERKVSGK